MFPSPINPTTGLLGLLAGTVSHSIQFSKAAAILLPFVLAFAFDETYKAFVLINVYLSIKDYVCSGSKMPIGCDSFHSDTKCKEARGHSQSHLEKSRLLPVKLVFKHAALRLPHSDTSARVIPCKHFIFQEFSSASAGF